MRCYNHSDIEAVATCLGCGKAMCKDCCQTRESGIILCSESCQARVENGIEALNLIRSKTLTQSKVTGFFCIIAAAVMGLFGLFNLTRENYFLPISIFLLALCVSLTAWGIMYLKVGKTK